MKTLKKVIVLSTLFALLSMIPALTMKQESGLTQELTLASDLPPILSTSVEDGITVASDLPPILSTSAEDGITVASDLPPILTT